MKLITRRVTIVDPESLYVAVGERMREARDKSGLTQEQIGIQLGMTRANVANLEAGKTAIMLQHVYNLALYLEIPVSRLLPPVA
jgi:transcriptional regulator with XRE-family HTH domain